LFVPTKKEANAFDWTEYDKSFGKLQISYPFWNISQFTFENFTKWPDNIDTNLAYWSLS
jgi:hypothetical protein